MSGDDNIDPRVTTAIERCRTYCIEYAPSAGYTFELATVMSRSGEMHSTLLLIWWQELVSLIDEPNGSPEHEGARMRFASIDETVTDVGADKSWIIVRKWLRENKVHTLVDELNRRRSADKKRGVRDTWDDKYRIVDRMLGYLDRRSEFGNSSSLGRFKMSPEGKQLSSEIKANGDTVSDSTLKRAFRSAKEQYEKNSGHEKS